MDPMVKLKLLAVIVKECDKKQIKGGSLLSVVYSHLHHGNKILAGTVRKLLTSMSKPIYSTLVWTCRLVIFEQWLPTLYCHDVNIRKLLKKANLPSIVYHTV